jgi:hypothetical protein
MRGMRLVIHPSWVWAKGSPAERGVRAPCSGPIFRVAQKRGTPSHSERTVVIAIFVMSEKPAGDELSRAYREAAERLATESQAAVQRAQTAMATTPGWEAAAKAAAAQSVLEATMASCDAIVVELLEAHLDHGERNAEAVAKRLREHVLANLTEPGFGLFEDSGPESAVLRPVLLRHAAEFELWRDHFERRLEARFRQALETRESRIPMLEIPSAWQRVRESRAVFALLLATAALSACGVSWADITRKVLGFL